ncbi:MAG TPA: alpha/beta hydrolase [Acidimicrobiales bacterium]
MPTPRKVPSTAGVMLALHDLGGDGPPLLLCHPTGFHGMVWAPVAAELATVARCWALDFRGHGDSTSPADGRFAWDGMADDVLAAIDHLHAVPAFGVGHSMGGAAMLAAEQRRPGTFSGLWLFEPIVIARGEGVVARPNPLAAAARRRRPRFPSREAAYDNFAAKPPLATLAPDALRAYVDHGLRDVAGGDEVELKCDPEVEARVFDAGMRHRAADHLSEVRCPVTVAVSGDASIPALAAPGIAAALPAGRLERHPNLTHFGPMEDPPAVASAIRTDLGLG